MPFKTKPYEEKMKKTIAGYKSNLDVIRAGQANPMVLSRVTFDYYNTPTPINTMADIRVADAKTLVISPYDRTTLKAIEKAILASDVGITPNNDGTVLRLVFPRPTEERRLELVKQIQKMGEEAKISVRNIRREANETVKKMKKNGDLTEDDQKLCEKEIQDLTDKYIKITDEVTADKSGEIMKI